jgi:hypothetical protein
MKTAEETATALWLSVGDCHAPDCLACESRIEAIAAALHEAEAVAYERAAQEAEGEAAACQRHERATKLSGMPKQRVSVEAMHRCAANVAMTAADRIRKLATAARKGGAA